MTAKSEFNFPGIYTITNRKNGKTYVGQALNIRKRWSGHIYSLKLNSHRNRHLQNSWNKNGREVFDFAVVEDFTNITDQKELETALDESEIKWLIKLQDNSFNLMQAVEHGLRATPEVKEWFKAHHKRLWEDDDLRARRIASITASYNEGDLRQRRKESSSAYNNTPEALAAASARFLAIWENPDHRETQSEKRKANWQNPNYVAKQKASRKAAWADPEVRERRETALRKAAKDPEVLAKRAAGIQKAWAEKKARGETKWNEEQKARHSAKFQEPEVKARRSAAQKLRFAKLRASKP